jgi:hypothetical protein
MKGGTMTKGCWAARFLIAYSVVFVSLGFPADLLALGRRDIQSQVIEGQEIWQAEYDISRLKKGTHNVIIRAKDPAGNISEDGPFNIRVDPKAALPLGRVVYPEKSSVVRSSELKVVGIATGRFGINRVSLRMDGGPVLEVDGSDYWSRLFEKDQLAEGRHRVSVQAFDGKDTPGPVDEVSFVMDWTPPEVAITSHQGGALLRGNVALHGRAYDINEIASLDISIDGGAVFHPIPLRRKSGRGRGEADFTIRLKTRELSDGPLLYIVRAIDTTGLISIQPYLFYIDNDPPVLDIISPKVDEAVWDTIRVTGSLIDAVGIEKFYYEWNGETRDIPINPGDPDWAVEVDIPYRMYRGNMFRVTAVDKVGNVARVSRQFRDLREIRAPTLIIEYPRQLDSLGANQAIYGRIAPGYDPATIIIEGVVEELDAMPAFRIPPEIIATGRSSLRIWAKAADDSLGDPVVIRTNRTAGGSAAPRTNITITSPGPYHWFRDSLTLEGTINAGGASLGGGRLEYRYSPAEAWKPLSYNQADGTFKAELPVTGLGEGAVHLELRTVLSGVEYFPFYYPVNRFTRDPDIQFISPLPEKGPVNGRVTVSGVVYSQVPVQDVSFSTNGRTWESMSILSAYQKYTFSMPVNFSMVQESEGEVAIRVTDMSGNVYQKVMELEIDAISDAPVIILNQPMVGEVLTGDFKFSGLVFDDDGAAAVHWRIVRKTNPEAPVSVRPEAEMPFQRIETNQLFDATVSMGALGDGEYYIEVVGEDIYGFRGRTLSRLVRVSTAAPVTTVTSPLSTVYNKKVIFVEGTCIDANGIGEIQVSLDNGLTWQQAEVLGDRWRFSLNTTSYGDGAYAILIRTYDKFGVESFSNALINIDNLSPDLALAQPRNGGSAGDTLHVAGRVSDNVSLASLSIELVNIADSSYRMDYKVEPRDVFYEDINIRSLPVGDYNLRMIAADLAANETVVSRNFQIIRDNTIAEVAIWNPMPGITHTGPMVISGRVTGAVLPKEVVLSVNRTPYATAPVDRHGLFRYEFPAEGMKEDVTVIFSASFDNPTGGIISSHEHEVKIIPYGPILSVDSHEDGDSITHRPWLSGRAWMTSAYLEEHQRLSWNERRFYEVEAVDISYDNGRTYERATGKENWKFRLETGEINRGALPVLIKATFVNGEIAIRRLALVVDVDPPELRTIQPLENSLHRDILSVYGLVSDDFEIDTVEVQLRPGDKFGYSVPKFIQGMYLDTHALGATWADVGLGLVFFENNVKLQFQFGITPEARFEGQVFGLKMLANLLYLPLDYYFGPDWTPFSTSLAIGANFSYFSMRPPDQARILGALLFQWEIIRVTLIQDDPNLEVKFRPFKYFSFYVEPNLWFASTDVNNPDIESMILRASLGFRLGIL